MSDSIAVPHRGDGTSPRSAPASLVRSPDRAGRLVALAIGSVGVVYGDIGTSPLYAFREAVNAAAGPQGSATPAAVLGVLSLILWALIFIVTF
ncbi:MAG: KUP/HAK/KT family potassium transporter, partial [Xanthobacteraceae bacterium]|nr:KUP/HAK/KT family potassium transporter [Xanthobacteraceae bacterium]